LIQAIATSRTEPEPFHNLVLAGECLRDVGPVRVDNEVATMITQQIQNELNRPIPQRPKGWAEFFGRVTGAADRRKALLRRRVAAANALSRIESGQFGSGQTYWSWPYGEPEWVAIPAGEFWMGSDQEADSVLRNARPAHRLFLPGYQIARTPVTNAQYQIYVDAAGAASPQHWTDGQPPKDKLNHPVVYVSWQDGCRYCEWLSLQTGRHIHLPTEAQWERAVRGDQDQRIYPWGDVWDDMNCNNEVLQLEDTTPVGLFLAGASPDGCLDMLGNVLEWTLSLPQDYPYQPDDGREDLQSTGEEPRVLRGGAFYGHPQHVRCAVRDDLYARGARHFVGFRFVLSSLPSL
jgi:formylglycine-generating enzyme required for sulfatase activity